MALFLHSSLSLLLVLRLLLLSLPNSYCFNCQWYNQLTSFSTHNSPIPTATTNVGTVSTFRRHRRQRQQLQYQHKQQNRILFLIGLLSAQTDPTTTDDGNHPNHNDDDDDNPSSKFRLDLKPKQRRRKMRHLRRPSNYWRNVDNIEAELRSFWNDVNVTATVSSTTTHPHTSLPPPTIPSEAILNHFERHDLRYAIANAGGREVVAERLGGAKIVPGKWNVAVKECEEVRLLLLEKEGGGGDDRNYLVGGVGGLERDVPPISPSLKRRLLSSLLSGRKESNCGVGGRGEGDSMENERMDTNIQANSRTSSGSVGSEEEGVITKELRFRAGTRWGHRSGRKPMGYWNQSIVIQELYDHLILIKQKRGRPSIWMPRPSELTTEGRDDLKQALARHCGKAKHICSIAHLVPYHEWRYFESQLELFVRLQRYLSSAHHRHDEKMFPRLVDVIDGGGDGNRLYDLILEFGGATLLAAKLDMAMQYKSRPESMFGGMRFGSFSLGFAVRLLHFIRRGMMAIDPSSTSSLSSSSSSNIAGAVIAGSRSIRMPTIRELVDAGEVQLAKEVQLYGGHENIARRLGLGLCFDRQKEMLDDNLLD